MESSKSLDTVDDQTLYNNNGDDNNNNSNNGTAATSTGSKLPRSLTFTYKKSPNHHNSNLIQNKSAEPLFDHIGNEEMPLTGKSTENISRSSSTGGSLSLVSNLNDTLPANDMSDDESLIDLRTRLTAIDENSLSPLPSLNLMMPTDDNDDMKMYDNNGQILANDNTLTNMENNNDQPERSPSMAENESTLINDNNGNSITNEPTQPIEPSSTPPPLQSLPQIVDDEIVDDESVTLSLNSVEINEERHQQPEKLIKKQPNVMNNNKRPGQQQTNLVTNRTKLAKSGNLRPPTITNRITKRTNNNAEKLNNNNNKNTSSRPNSANVSRCTTPALSETDSVCSSTTYNASTTNKLLKCNGSIITANTIKQRPLSRNNNNNNNNAPMAKNVARLPKTANNKTGTGTIVSNSIKRSTTYSRSLNQAPQIIGHNNLPASNVKENITTNDTGTDKNAQKSFAKPTTSYLRKASVAATKRPTSAASANSTTSTVTPASSVTSIPGSRIGKNYLNGTLSNKPRPPTTLLTLAATRSTSNSANSSRRSSINSPTKPASLNSSKKDILNQLQYYEGLCYDRTKQIENLEQDLYQSSRTTLGLLTMTAYILNEYRPFTTPKLESDLTAVRQNYLVQQQETEAAKVLAVRKQAEVTRLIDKVKTLNHLNEKFKKDKVSAEKQQQEIQTEMDKKDEQVKKIETELIDVKNELANEKQERLETEKRLEKAECMLKTDKKYRELKEKISNYEKEVDSLNVVVDMKMQRIHHLEREKMRTELELTDYEQLKESYQRLQRENEALTEALGMKARKNAEQSKELDVLRTELKRETNERKRLSVRNDQLEFQLNESRDFLNNLSTSLFPINEENNLKNINSNVDAVGEESLYFTPIRPPVGDTSNFIETGGKSVPGGNETAGNSSIGPNRGNSVRRLFSTPMISDSKFKSRCHYQHQDPANFGSSSASHRLPEVVLSSMNANNCRSLLQHSHHHHHHHHHHHKMVPNNEANINGHQMPAFDPSSPESSLTSSNSEDRERTMSE